MNRRDCRGIAVAGLCYRPRRTVVMTTGVNANAKNRFAKTLDAFRKIMQRRSDQRDNAVQHQQESRDDFSNTVVLQNGCVHGANRTGHQRLNRERLFEPPSRLSSNTLQFLTTAQPTCLAAIDICFLPRKLKPRIPQHGKYPAFLATFCHSPRSHSLPSHFQQDISCTTIAFPYITRVHLLSTFLE